MIDVAVVGAGPVGLAAAIEARRRGLSCTVLEKGCVVNAIFEYPTYMVFFTTAELLEIGGHPLVAARERPDRKEALDYYRLVAQRESLDLRQYTEVTRVHPAPAGFTLELETKAGDAGILEARTVVVATGYYDNPNQLGIPGEDLENVSHYYTEPHPFWGLDVTIVGAGNSAADAALDLYRHGANVTLIHRGPGMKPTVKYWVKPDVENRIREGSIRALFDTTVQEIRPGAVLGLGPNGPVEVATDFTFLLAGYSPETSLIEGAGVRLDADGCVPHDPETFETRDRPGLYVVGSAAFGRFTNQVFIENGREHALRAIANISEVLRGREADAQDS